MTRKSKREIERLLEEFEATAPTGEFANRPELTPGEKEALADLFDVHPWADGESDAHRILNELSSSEEGR